MFAYQGNKNYKGSNGPHKGPPGNQCPPKLRSSSKGLILETPKSRFPQSFHLGTTLEELQALLQQTMGKLRGTQSEATPDIQQVASRPL